MRPDAEVTAAAERTAEVLWSAARSLLGAGELDIPDVSGWVEDTAEALRDANLLADPAALRERDEAVAAVERVRALADEVDEYNREMARQIRTALGERP